ncbi:MAG: aldo/keto reductase [Inquilinus sp.]|nr:aldo/keto reductase [Inquilinus sp.]
MRSNRGPGRRAVLASLGALGLAAGLAPRRAGAQSGPQLTKPIPATGERLPVIGMGSWLTFDVGDDPALRDARVEVLRAFFEAGGGMIDSSPMYGSSEAVIGHCLERIGDAAAPFSATKVWTVLQSRGVSQMEASERLWAPQGFDLMQVHNLLDWRAHLETLAVWKARGRVRYVGITTSHGRRHPEMAELMTEQPLDFVQLTYNILDRRAERALLPLAAERGLAVIANRPFRRSRLFDLFQRHPLPAWAGEIDCANWAQFLLKFVISHPAVTCAIPATSRVDHMRENMGAAHGRLPDAAMRQRMVRYVEGL